MPDTPETREPRKLRIWQQNINHSLEGQLDLLHSLKSDRYDMVVIQERHIDFMGHMRANLHWTVIYPRQHLSDPRKNRSVILVNCDLYTNNWDDLNIMSYNMMGVRIHGTYGAICMLNIYNDCANNRSLAMVEEFMRRREERVRVGSRRRERVIWVATSIGITRFGMKKEMDIYSQGQH